MNNQKEKMATKIINIIKYSLFLICVLFFADTIIFRQFLKLGYPRHHEEENLERYPTPYVMFSGKPNALTHNKFGFRGRDFEKATKNDFKIAFFGGSTGYNGQPPIPYILEKQLSKILNTNVFVANYSVVSSNHRQHLHGIIEYLPAFQPDLVVFYGGFNETVTPGKMDPRPGYPPNHFYRAELNIFRKLLLKYSAIAGILDIKTGRISKRHELVKRWKPYSKEWNNNIKNNYIQTLEIAKYLTSINSVFYECLFPLYSL